MKLDDFESVDYDETNPLTKRSTALKVTLLVLKILVWVLCLSVTGFLVLRINLSKTPKAFRELTWTPEMTASAEAAIAAGGKLDVTYQQNRANIDDKGLFMVTDLAFAEENGQVQISVRWNRRFTINWLMERYSLSERPSGEQFIFMLTDDKGSLYTKYTFAAKENAMYAFRRVIFDGVDLSDLDTLYLDVYYGEDVSPTCQVSANFVIYDKNREKIPVKTDKPKSTDLTFIAGPAYQNHLN